MSREINIDAEEKTAVIGDLLNLSGKAAVVMGGTAGVGWAIASLFAKAGAEVLAVDTGETSNGHSADDAPRRIAFTTCNIADEFSVNAVAECAVARSGGIDILVNAAVLFTNRPLLELSVEDWDRTQSVNLRGAFLATRACIASMRERGGGRIINVSTIGSVHPMLRGNGAYSASRAGLNQFTRNCAFDFAPDHITANVIMTGGIVDQALTQTSPVQGPGAELARHIGGYGEPVDVAGMALFLAARTGRFISGQAIAVDGGFLVG